VPLSPEAAVALTGRLYARLDRRRGDVQKRNDYFEGKQPLRFASAKWAEYHAARYEEFCDNWCGPVANSPNERLRVDGFRLDDDPQLSDAERELWRDWQSNDMEAQSSAGFLASIIAARSFVLVWGDEEDQPVATWERADQVIVDCDPERPTRRTAALKAWFDDDREYATLYTGDEVWKWQRPRIQTAVYRSGRVDVPPGGRADAFFNRTTASGLYVAGYGSDGDPAGGWEPRQPPDDDTWPLANPLGVVPVVEMPNRPMLGGKPLSDIAGTMAMQDAINLLWAYLFTAADFASMPARVVMGQEPPKVPILDAQGQRVGEKTVDLKRLAEDRILWLTGQNTKISQWDAARLDVFTGVIEIAVTHVAAQTRTPPHYLVLGKGLVNVNAEGMKTAETGLVMKVGEQQTFFGPSTREIFRLFALVRGQTDLADQARTGVIDWKDAENHSEAQLVDALVKLQTIGFPFQWIAEKYGLSQTEVARVLAMKATEADEDPLSVLTRAARTPPPDAGAAGQPPGGPPAGG
jgi:hypothetical protein